jgi:hypothetical protein
MCLSGGNAWLNDHKKILDHAEGLHYDHYLEEIGKSLPSAVDPNDFTAAEKQKWISSMDAFNAWKAREVAKQADGQAWWQTYQSDSGGDGGDNGGGGGGGGPDWDNPDPGTGTGPYPDSNIYFPMLVPEYEAPAAQDWGRYMPRGQQGANVRPGDIWGGSADLGRQGGLLYQPWTSTYADRFVPDSLWNYNPPELKVGRPQFYQNPLGILEVVHHQPESESSDDPNDPNDTRDLENRGGKGPGDVGYDPANDSDVSLADAVAGLFGLTDFNDWGDVQGDDSVGGFPGTGAFGSTSPTE